jgi:hypothetical protein
MINCPKPILGKNVAQQSDFVVPNDKVSAREIRSSVLRPSETEPLSLRNDKVQDVTRWMAGSNERNAPILLSKSAGCGSTYNRLNLLFRNNKIDHPHIDRRRTLQQSNFVIAQ